MILLLLFLVIAVFLFNEFYWKRRHLPPGPCPVPFIGNFNTIAKYEPGYKAFDLWRKQFGDVFTVWLGPYPAVFITDLDIMRESDAETHAHRFFIGSVELRDMFRGGCYGIVQTSGSLWRGQRKFTQKVLRDFGVGRDLMESKVMTEVDMFLSRLPSEGFSVNINKHISTAAGSIVCNLLFGHGFDTQDRLDEFHELEAMLTDMLVCEGKPEIRLMKIFPILRHLPTERVKSYKEKVQTFIGSIFGFFEREFNNHRAEINYDNEVSSDFVEAFLKEQRKHELNGEQSDFHDLQLKNICFDIWAAGLDTTTNTLTWSVVYLLRHPECQRKLHAELDRVMGADERVRWADRARMPYTCAVISESQRLGNIIPINVLRRVERDTVIGGHRVPKGTCVVPQISAVLNDEKIFPDPYTFNPERFIADGQLIKCEQLVPFSHGRRVCVGEGLARMELFLLLANLFLHYELVPDGEPPSDFKASGGTIPPQPFTCKLRPRR